MLACPLLVATWILTVGAGNYLVTGGFCELNKWYARCLERFGLGCAYHLFLSYLGRDLAAYNAEVSDLVASATGTLVGWAIFFYHLHAACYHTQYKEVG